MIKKLSQILFSFSLLFSLISYAEAHCEIPCGIYDDEMRVNMIAEEIITIEKSMNQINTIEKSKTPDYNQLIRWVMNKDHHADMLQDIVAKYFMTQRIKPDTKEYDKKLALLHQMLIYSMKCKQTTDLDNINKLRTLVQDFKSLYFPGK
jgi:nickel superoxide dismutase